MAQTKRSKRGDKGPLSFEGLPFEEVVSDLLKAKPPPNKPKKGGKGRKKK